MKTFFIYFLAIGFFNLAFLPGETRSKIIRPGFRDSKNEPAQGFAPGKQYLILIAIDNYLHWPHIQGAVNEAQKLNKVLVTRYHFDYVIEVYNNQATKKAIRDCLISLQRGRENQLEENDSLFIYFSGHGKAFEEETWNGYWIPYNGGVDTDARAYWISNSELTGLINKIKSKHILIVSDSCFASTLVDNRYSYTNKSRGKRHVHEIYNRCSRKVLTSGGLERVPGQSVFTELLIDELNKNRKSWIGITEIYRLIEWEVFEKTGNHPEYGNLKNTEFDLASSYILFTRKCWEKQVKKAHTF